MNESAVAMREVSYQDLPAKMQDDLLGYVYVIEVDDCVKIGCTKHPKQRVLNLKLSIEVYGNRKIGRIAFSEPHYHYQENEKILHKHFATQRVGQSELFSLSFDKAVSQINKGFDGLHWVTEEKVDDNQGLSSLIEAVTTPIAEEDEQFQGLDIGDADAFHNFVFGENIVRVLLDKNPWFVGSDVAKILDFDVFKLNSTVKLQNWHYGFAEDREAHTAEKVMLINQSGIVDILIASKPANAKEFYAWIANEVVPSARSLYKDAQSQLTSLVLEDPQIMIDWLNKVIQRDKERQRVDEDNNMAKLVSAGLI